MKRKLIFRDMINNKVTTTEVEVRDLKHIDAQIRYPALVQRPKKGKGSFTRKSKYKEDFQI